MRPEKIKHRARGRRAERARMPSPARVTEIGYLGDISVYKVKLDNGAGAAGVDGQHARARLEQPIQRGDRVWLSLRRRGWRGADAMSARERIFARPRRWGPRLVDR